MWSGADLFLTPLEGCVDGYQNLFFFNGLGNITKSLMPHGFHG
jgi:hypothetical protein